MINLLEVGVYSTKSSGCVQYTYKHAYVHVWVCICEWAYAYGKKGRSRDSVGLSVILKLLMFGKCFWLEGHVRTMLFFIPLYILIFFFLQMRIKHEVGFIYLHADFSEMSRLYILRSIGYPCYAI